MTPKYPIIVKLSGTDGNAFAVLGRVAKALKQSGVGQEEIDLFYEEATSGNFSHLLQICMKWVDVE